MTSRQSIRIGDVQVDVEGASSNIRVTPASAAEPLDPRSPRGLGVVAVLLTLAFVVGVLVGILLG